MPRKSARDSKRAFLKRAWPYLAIVGFAAVVFGQLSSISAVRRQYSDAEIAKLPNNGTESTFFAIHSEPYLLFSEDFHLFHLRAKRVLERGWQGSLMAQDSSLPRNTAAPFQLLLSVLALASGGGAFGYSLFTALLLVAAWSMAYRVADRYLPPGISRLSLLGALIVAVVFQDRTLVGSEWESSLWFTGRMLRISSYSWSNPMLLSALILLTHLATTSKVQRQDLGWLGFFLVWLAGSDNRSYLPVLLGSGAVCVVLAGRWFVAAARVKRPSLAPSPRPVVVAGALVLGSFLLQRWLFGAMEGDAITRAGVGPDWLGSVGKFKFNDYYFNEFKASAIQSAKIALPLLILQIRAFEMRRVLGLFTLNAVTGYACLAIVAQMGIRAFQTPAFYIRTDFVILFVWALTLLETGRRALDWAFKKGAPAWRDFVPKLFAIAVAIGLLQVAGALNAGLDRYVHVTGAKVLALTESLEAVRDWARALPEGGRGKTIATLSPEINLLLAYWTKADMALPSGFPYHSIESDESIAQRLAAILRLYRVSPESWDRFDLRNTPADQKSWYASRELAGKEGFLYYAFHMSVYRDGDWGGGAPYHARVREMLTTQPQASADYVVVDEVSRAAGMPDLSAYRRVESLRAVSKDRPIEIYQRLVN